MNDKETYFDNIGKFDLALARRDYAEALRIAREQMTLTTVPSEVVRWLTRADALELKMTSGWDRMLVALGFRSVKKA